MKRCLKTFDPPADLDDFGPDHRAAWSRWMSAKFDRVIHELHVDLAGSGASPQFYNPTKTVPEGDFATQEIRWNAFPKDLVRCFGREQAMKEADRLWSLCAFQLGVSDMHAVAALQPKADDLVFRPQSEYCEWRVDRDPATDRIVRVTFTSEPPEYWQAMHGTLNSPVADFPTSLQAMVLQLYRDNVDPRVQPDDLIAPKCLLSCGFGPTVYAGDYNPYNRWNTRDGIMHLCCPPSALAPEIALAAEATLHYHDAAGLPLTYPDALICGAGFGNPNRNSDPAIGCAVNALARLGAQVTMATPVGIYMDRIDTNAWEMPGGIPASSCWRIVRGRPGMISRLVVEMPPGSGHTLSELRVGGVPLEHGGQLAECVTVKLRVQAVLPATSQARAHAAAMQPSLPAPQTYVIYDGNPSQIVTATRPGQPAPGPSNVAFGGYGG